jgi:hypothetical protein
MNVIKINIFIFFIVFKRLFNEGNRKHFFRVSIELLALRAGVRTQFLVAPKLPRVFLLCWFIRTPCIVLNSFTNSSTKFAFLTPISPNCYSQNLGDT